MMPIPPGIAKFFASMAGKALLVLLTALAVWWFVSAFISGQQAKRDAKLAREQSAAVLDSVDAAARITADRDKTVDEMSTETKELADEILNEPPGNSNPAAVSAVCGMRAYVDHPECAGVRAGGPAKPAGRNPAR